MKPNLQISDFIAKNNKNEYRIKIVNMSKFYITNVFIQAQLVTISNGNGGNVLNSISLKIPYENLKVISPYDQNDLNAPYAIRLAIQKNLEDIWIDDDRSHLKLIIYCSNEHNNSSKLYEKIYYKKSSIKEGSFKFGTSLEIE